MISWAYAVRQKRCGGAWCSAAIGVNPGVASDGFLQMGGVAGLGLSGEVGELGLALGWEVVPGVALGWEVVPGVGLGELTALGLGG